MITLATTTSPIDAAWAAFDAAAIAMHRMYRNADQATDTPDARAMRMAKAEEVLRLWNAWRALFLADAEPRPAA